MNDRIKLLWDEAWDDDTPLSIIRERFAELIVKECGAVALNIGCGDIEDELLKHFGVEE